jgi:hypothetical protein
MFLVGQGLYINKRPDGVVVIRIMEDEWKELYRLNLSSALWRKVVQMVDDDDSGYVQIATQDGDCLA